MNDKPRVQAERIARKRGRRLPPAYNNKRAYLRWGSRAEIAGARASSAMKHTTQG